MMECQDNVDFRMLMFKSYLSYQIMMIIINGHCAMMFNLRVIYDI